MDIEVSTTILILLIGGVAGWLAGMLMKGGGFGAIGNIIVGVIGAFVGGFLFSTIGVSIGSGIINSIVSATVGAIILLFIVKLLKRT